MPESAKEAVNAPCKTLPFTTVIDGGTEGTLLRL
jgi:hypothetical protein